MTNKVQDFFNFVRAQPRSQVLSPTSLSHSIGADRREPWKRGWYEHCYPLKDVFRLRVE